MGILSGRVCASGVILMAVGLVMGPRYADAAPVQISIIEYADVYTQTTGLGQSLADLGYSYTDLTGGLLAGGAINLTGRDTLIIGSHCTNNLIIKGAIEAASQTLRNFVAAGNTVIMLTQADQDYNRENWLESPRALHRCDTDFANVKRVQSSHPIFTTPNAISDADLSGWTLNSGFASSWESLDLFREVAVLAGDSATKPVLSTIVEAAWGSGRAVVVAMAADKARNIGNAQGKTHGLRLLRNLVQYAQSVHDGSAPAIQIYNNPLTIAIIDYQDAYTNTKGLAQSLTDQGYTYTDLTAGLVAGGALTLSPYNVFIVGSHATQNATVKAALVAGQPAMSSFVDRGGAMIMLTQADQDRADESWMPLPAQVRRGDFDFSPVVRLQPAHQIFTKPNAISDANLSGWAYSSALGSWESFEVFRGVGVLAADTAASHTYGTLLEAGWGYGRAVFTSLAPDKARNIGNAQAIAQAPRCLRNLLEYCLDVLNGHAADVVLYENPLRVAIVDFQDQYSTTKGLGTALTAQSVGYTDLTATLTGGGALNLTGYNTFILGGLATDNDNIAAAIEAGETNMRNFVNAGGTVIMLTQADQDRAPEDWLPAPASVIRADPDFDAVWRLQPLHQVFQRPNLLTDGDLSGWLYRLWPSSWESFSTFQNVAVLAGDHSTEPSLGTILEAGWGYGRAMLLSMAPDKAAGVGNAQAQAQAPRLLQNLVQYARDVQNGRAANVIVTQTAGYAGPIGGYVYNDLNHNGQRDAGEPGIGGVGVSDSVSLVLTAADGSYTLTNAANDATLLYVCIPAGYDKKADWFRHIQVGSGGNTFDFGLTPVVENGSFDFVQVSDVHVGGSGNRQLYTEAIADICGLTHPPKFLIATGDLADVGSNTTHYSDYAAATATSALPLFNVMGNHDQNNSGSVNYRKWLGPDYYSFNLGDCHFLILNSVFPSAQQTAWVNADLSMLRGNRRLFVFQHYSPSETEHTQFAGWQATAVFTGHWHSQHSVMVGSMRSYNSPTLLFGGIDCSPASFKVTTVNANNIGTRTRYLADGKRLQIVTPNAAQLVPRSHMPILVNAYETTADLSSVTYVITAGGQPVAGGSLTRQGDWSWVGQLNDQSLAAGSYDIQVTATDDKGEINTASATFAVLNRRAQRPKVVANWPQFGGGPKRGGLVTNATITPSLGLSWMSYTGGTIDFGSPILYDDAVFVGVKDRTDFTNNGVLALRVNDGSTKWFATTPAAVSHAVAADGTRVYANSHGGILHALNQTTGQTLYTRTLGSEYQRWLYGAPVYFGNRVYSGTYAYFAGFDTATGSSQWNKTYGIDWISSNACPATDGNVVIVPTVAGNDIRAVSAATGNTVWQFTTVGCHGSPVIANDRVVFTTYDGLIYAVSLANGTQIWSVSADGRSATTPAVSGNTVVAGGTGSVRAYRLDNGQLLWNFPVATSPFKMSPYNNTYASLIGSPSIVGSTVYVPCGDGRLYALSLSSGSLIWSMNFGAPILSAPCISGNSLFLTTYDGHVYALTDMSGFGPPADFDGDGDVDAADTGHLIGCLQGAEIRPLPPGCADVDLDADGDADLGDFGLFQRCASGTDITAAANCAD